jgi:hypothetical protein
MRFFEAKAHGLQDSGNPLFPRKEVRRRWWPVILLLLVITAGVTTLAGLVYSPYFAIKNIEVHGVATLDPAAISAKVREQFELKRFLILPNSHQWFFDANSAEVVLKNSFPLKSADIQKVGASLRVTIVEDIFMVAFRSGDTVYFLDPTGKLLRPAEPNEQAAVLAKVGVTPLAEVEPAIIHVDMPVLHEKTATEHVAGEQFYTESMVQNLIQFADGLRAMGIQPVEFVSDDVNLPWFTILSDKEYVILFDATENVDTQLAVLKAVIDERFATSEDLPRYIDIRFGNRVYVR